MVFVKKCKIFHLFISSKIGEGNMFRDILETRNACLDHKNKEVKNTRKIGIFPKGLVHSFGHKFETFPFP